MNSNNNNNKKNSNKNNKKQKDFKEDNTQSIINNVCKYFETEIISSLSSLCNFITKFCQNKQMYLDFSQATL